MTRRALSFLVAFAAIVGCGHPSKTVIDASPIDAGKAGFVTSGGFVTPIATNGTGGAGAGITDVTGDGVADKAITAIDNTGAATVAYFVDTCANGTGTTCSVTNNSVTTNVNLAGGTATNGQQITAISAAGAATLSDPAWPIPSSMFYFEEFCSTPTADNLISFSATGTGTSNTATTNVQGRPCLDDMVAGTTATTGRALWASAGTQQIQFGSGSGKWKWYFSVQLPTLSVVGEQYSFLIGPSSAISSTINPSAGFWFMYDRENVATAPATGAGNTGNKDKWICRSGDAGAYTEYVADGTVVSDASFTTVDSPVVGGTWYKLEIDYDSTLGTPEVDYFVNGTKVCAITTHIPTATGATHATGLFSAIILRGATVVASRDALVDYAAAYNYGLSR